MKGVQPFGQHAASRDENDLAGARKAWAGKKA